MRIALDLDGVCFDFVAALRDFCARAWRVDPSTFGPATCWDFFVHDWGWTRSEFNDAITDAIELGEIYSRRGYVYPGVREGIAHLRERGHMIHVITDRARFGPPGLAAGQTIEWLAQEDIHVDSVTFAEKKGQVLAADIAFDDAVHHWEAYRTHGVLCVLRDHPYNQETSATALRTPTFDGFVQLVESLDHQIPIATLRALYAPSERRAS